MAEAPISATPHVFYIRPAPGWLDLLFLEVTELIQTPLQKYKYEPKITLLNGTVKLHRCDWRQGLEVMSRLTTAHDVEWLIMESKCNKWTEVDAILTRVRWDEILPTRDIPVHVSTDVFNAFSSASAKLRENLCKMAGVTHVSEGGQIRFKIELRGDRLRVSVSLCGDPLYKRGYKAVFGAHAPLPEHQAAASVKWILEGKTGGVETVYVPFAGSGTFGFESLVVLSGAGPAAFQRSFSCELFPCTPPATIKFFRKKLSERLSGAKETRVIFNDFNADAIAMLKANITAFPGSDRFSVLEGDVFKSAPEISGSGPILILLNPPYGDRLAKDSAIVSLYGRLGSLMRAFNEKYESRMVGGCLCPDKATWSRFLKELDSSSAETHHFTHGGKEMRLVRWKN